MFTGLCQVVEKSIETVQPRHVCDEPHQGEGRTRVDRARKGVTHRDHEMIATSLDMFTLPMTLYAGVMRKSRARTDPVLERGRLLTLEDRGKPTLPSRHGL
jgi:hypothetical protein